MFGNAVSAAEHSSKCLVLFLKDRIKEDTTFSTMIGYWEIFQSEKAASHMRVTTALTIFAHNWRYGVF